MRPWRAPSRTRHDAEEHDDTVAGHFDAMRKAMNWNAEPRAERSTRREFRSGRSSTVNRRRKPCWAKSWNDRSDEEHREREIEAGRSDIIPSQERHDETLKGKNKTAFLPRHVLEPEVRIRHPSCEPVILIGRR